MDEPGCISDARVGEGSRRVQPDRARLQSQARSQYRRVPKVGCRAPSLKAAPEHLLTKVQAVVERHGIGQVFHKSEFPAQNLTQYLDRGLIIAADRCFRTVCKIPASPEAALKNGRLPALVW